MHATGIARVADEARKIQGGLAKTDCARQKVDSRRTARVHRNLNAHEPKAQWLGVARFRDARQGNGNVPPLDFSQNGAGQEQGEPLQAYS